MLGSHRHLARLLSVMGCAALLTVVVLAVPDWSGATRAGRAHAAATKSVAMTFRYKETSASSADGPRSGGGTFSGKLKGRAASLARALAAAAGVPYSALTKGGTYAVRFTTDAKGAYT